MTAPGLLTFRVLLRKASEKVPGATKDWIAEGMPGVVRISWGRTGTGLQSREIRTGDPGREALERAQGKLQRGYKIVSVHGLPLHGPVWGVSPAQTGELPEVPPEPEPEPAPAAPAAEQPSDDNPDESRRAVWRIRLSDVPEEDLLF